MGPTFDQGVQGVWRFGVSQGVIGGPGQSEEAQSEHR